eukprot:scaffold294872_cov20-Prasinocladus_malaysianus.AAC.1
MTCREYSCYPASHDDRKSYAGRIDMYNCSIYPLSSNGGIRHDTINICNYNTTNSININRILSDNKVWQ